MADLSTFFYGNMVPGDLPLPDDVSYVPDGRFGYTASSLTNKYDGFSQLWINSLPYDDQAKQVIRGNLSLLATDYLVRMNAAVQAGYAPDQVPSFPQYIANLNSDGLLYSLDKTVFYQNATEGMTGLSQQEQNLLAQYAYQLATEHGIHVPSQAELLQELRHLDPTYGYQAFINESGLSPEEKNRLSQLYGTLSTEAENQGITDFYQWVSQQPARQLLLEYDPSYALNQYIAGQQLSSSQQSALRNNYDALAQMWQEAGQPGSFYSWLGTKKAPELAGAVEPEQAYTDWATQAGRTLNASGQSNLNRAYERELARYQQEAGPNKPKTFQDYIKQRSPGDVSLGQSPADLGHILGRTRWLSF